LLKDDAREWLMKNGYAHLMAMINGAEGNKEAIHWLEKSKFEVLKHIALAGDRDQDSLEWLKRNNHFEFAMIAERIRVLKDQIEDTHNDVHSINLD
jgi:ferritin-like protein